VILRHRPPSARSSLESTQYRSVTTKGIFWDNVSLGGFRQDKAEPLGSALVYWEFGLDLLKGKCLKVYGGETGILDFTHYSQQNALSFLRGTAMVLFSRRRHKTKWRTREFHW
jgi:hypothetical protein